MNPSQPARLHLSLWRLIVLSALSAGVYYVYWVFLTWKQLAMEHPDGRFYPVWHALTLLVPVYAQFQIHRHTALIKGLATTSAPERRLSPAAIVIIYTAAVVAGLGSVLFSSPILILVLLIANLILLTSAMVWPQDVLNRHWRERRGEVREVRLGVGETVLVLAGLVIWILPPVAQAVSAQ